MRAATGDVTCYADPREWPADVQALVEQEQARNMQAGALWYRNLIDTVFTGDGTQHFHVLRQGGQAVAMLALRVPPAARGQIESLSNFYTCLYSPVFREGLAATELVPLIDSIVRAHAPLASLRLAPMDPASASHGLLMEACRAAGLRPFGFFSFGNWFLPVEQDWPTYLKAREGVVRSTIKRMGKRFATENGTLEIITGGERLAAGLAAYEQVYAASWKNAEPFPAFMPGLIKLCAEQGWLRLGVAWLDGHAIAAQVWMVANGRAEIYKLAYDEAFKSYSPGTLLTALLMAHVFEQDRVAEVDYLIGDDPYKKAWMTQRRERWGIIAYNPGTLAGRLGFWREGLSRRAKPWLSRVAEYRRSRVQPVGGPT
ncbi:hypothetical protein BH11PSE9_BH11PSE9_01590 [soil metagenome]